MKNLIINRDFLSPSICLEYNGSNTYKCIEGGLYSLIIIILTVLIGCMFGQDLIFRNNPIMLNNQEMLTYSEVKLIEFPIAFLISYNSELNSSTIDYLDVDMVSFPIFSNYSTGRTIFANPLKKCNLSDYHLPQVGLDHLFNFYNSPGVYCIDNKNLSFYNPYSKANSSFINIRFKRCNTPGKGKCPTNIDSITQNINIVMAYLDSYIDSSNLTYPIQYQMAVQSYVLSNGLLKRFTHKFRNDVYYSDDGWFMSDVKTFNYISLDFVTSDIIVNTDINSAYYNHLYWATLESPFIRMRTNRSFLKIQDLLSNVGGFISIFVFLMQLLVSNHLRYKYMIFLRDLALSSRLNDKNVLKLSTKENNINEFNREIPSINTFLKERDNIQSCMSNIKTNRGPPNENQMKIIACNNFTQDIQSNSNFAKSINFLAGSTNIPSEFTKKLTIVGVNEKYINYIVSYICCNKESRARYELLFMSIEKMISVETYCKIIALTLNSS